MPSFIEVPCRCGRMVRTTPEQGGTTVRCWNCSSDVAVPAQGSAGKMIAEFAAAARESLGPQSLSLDLGVAVGLTAVLMIPYVGNLLGLALLVVGARLYQAMIREYTPPARAGGPDDPEADEPPDAVQWGVSALAAVGLLAPFWARGWSNGLFVPARWGLVALGMACWVVVPVALYLLNAGDRRGAVPPRLALAALARHPVAALAALLLLPLGLGLVEVASGSIAGAEGQLLRLISDHFPRPSLEGMQERVGWVYRYDDRRRSVPIGHEGSTTLPVYRAGLSRGFTLAGTIPRGLSSGLEARPDAISVGNVDVGYLSLRAVLTMIIITWACIVLSIQARWLGLIALLGTRRGEEATATSTSTRPQAPSLPHVSPPPAPVAPPAPAQTQTLATIPLAPAALNSTPATVAAAPWGFAALSPAAKAPAAGPPAARTVLIVDSDRGFAVGLAHLLSARGFGVIVAGGVSEALAITSGARPDLIVLDTMLPDRSGIQLCHELRAAMPGPDRPVLIATSQTATSAEISSMAVAADDYMVKPYVIEALIIRINQHLKNRP